MLFVQIRQNNCLCLSACLPVCLSVCLPVCHMSHCVVRDSFFVFLKVSFVCVYMCVCVHVCVCVYMCVCVVVFCVLQVLMRLWIQAAGCLILHTRSATGLPC